MNKKTKTIVTICLDIIMLAVIITAGYFILTGRLQGRWQLVAQIAIIVAIPSIFFLSTLSFGMAKYEKLRSEDIWEEESEDSALESEEPTEDNKNAPQA